MSTENVSDESKEETVQLTKDASSKSAAKAYQSNNNNNNTFKLVLLVLMVLQNSSTVLVGRYTRSSVPKEELYRVNHLIWTAEMGKLLLSCALEYYSTNYHLWQSIQDNILARPTDTLKSLVPAILYLFQNTLLYVALSNLSAPLFQVTYQCKLVTTALVSVVMLNRKYNFKQWVCLFVLSIGVAIVVLGEKQNDDKPQTSSSNDGQSLSVGLVAVTLSCLSSALAGVYFEKVLKVESAGGKPPVSLWMRNMQLAFFSVVIASGREQWDRWFQPEDYPFEQDYFFGFTMWVWILVALQAGGGMLVAAVIKYADNVLKGLATGVSVVVATSFSMIVFHVQMAGQFFVGATMILISVYLFSNDIPKQCMVSWKNKVKTVPDDKGEVVPQVEQV